MKVVCVNKDNLYTYPSSPCKNITIGKVYEVIDIVSTGGTMEIKSSDLINIIDDTGEEFYYYRRQFDTLDNVRNEKLTVLGIV